MDGTFVHKGLIDVLGICVYIESSQLMTERQAVHQVQQIRIVADDRCEFEFHCVSFDRCELLRCHLHFLLGLRFLLFVLPVRPFTAMQILLALRACVFLLILHISWYPPKRHILILSCFVRFLDQLEIPAIVIEQVVPNATVVGVLLI
jgi:hypothetical protein